MYNWTIRYRLSNGVNLVNPYQISQGAYLSTSNGQVVANSNYAVTDFIRVNANQSYQGHSEHLNSFYRVAFYDREKRYIGGVGSLAVPVNYFTAPTNTYYVRLAVRSKNNATPSDPEKIGLTRGLGTSFDFYFTDRVVTAVYSKAAQLFEREGDYRLYRRKLDGNIKLLRNDFDFLNALPFDTEFYLKIEDKTGFFDTFIGTFFKTDCKWNLDDRSVEIKVEPFDNYTKVLGGLDKNFNIIAESPELDFVTIRRRPVIQIYCAGDKTITNVQGSQAWEQEIIIDPVFAANELINDYYFASIKSEAFISTEYADDLSINVTGNYSEVTPEIEWRSSNGQYKIVREENGGLQYRWRVRRTSNNAILYDTGAVFRWEETLSTVLFKGVNGQTGEFYVTEKRIFARYLCNVGNVRGVETAERPKEDIVDFTYNYTRVVPFSIRPERISFRQDSVIYPTEFGRFPEGTTRAGEYYKEWLLPPSSGSDQPIPIAKSQWTQSSIWLVPDLDLKYTEFIDAEDAVLRDTYALHSVIQILLTKIESPVTFSNSPEYSEFLYSATNPLGGFNFLDFNGGGLTNDYQGNLTHFLVPKSNMQTVGYTQAAMKAELSLGQVLNMLKNVYKCFWHIDENNRLRIEHVSWYQKGGTYAAFKQVGTDLTSIMQPRTLHTGAGKFWNYAQNKFEYDKEAMPERFEFTWMDDVKRSFEGYPINILSNYVQPGRIEDSSVNGVTTDMDFIIANPSLVSKDGWVLLGCVRRDNQWKVPFVQRNIRPDGYTSNVVMQNGFLSWHYLHPKFHIFDLPSDKVEVNGQEMTLSQNITQKKKQEVIYPAVAQVDPYKLVRTIIGDGIIKKLSIDMSSRIIKADLEHDTE